MGGVSAERKISLETGNAVLKVLKGQGIEAIAVDAVGDFIEILQQGSFDVVFIALHGPGGEDGTVQGLLDFINLPYTGSDVTGSAICIDKVATKRIWLATDLPTLPFFTAQPFVELDTKAIIKELSLPLAVKPVCEGSSIGISKVTKIEQLQTAYNKASKYGRVMIEPWVDGEEYAVAILRGKALPSVQIIPDVEFYDYDAKYNSDKTQYVCPSLLSKVEEENLKEIAASAFSVANGSGWGRVDFLRDKDGKFWLTEINTVPGLTEHSLVPMSARAIGMSFADLVLDILEQALDEETSKHYSVTAAEN